MKKINLKLTVLSIFCASLLIGCGKAQLNMNTPILPQQLMDYSQNTASTIVQTPVIDTEVKLPEGFKAISISIDGGDTSINLGSTKQFTTTVKLNNNKQINKFTNVKWDVSNPDIGSISKKGVFTPLREGKTKVIASIQGVSTEINVTVQPANHIWYQVTVPTTQNLNAVKMLSDNEAWAVGDGGTILHYYNGDWINYYTYGNSPAAGANLTGIDLLMDINEGWAVGENTIIRLYNGNWEKFPSPVSGKFNAVDALTQNDAFIVGATDDNKGLVLRYNGQSWQVMDTPIKGELNSVCALGPNDVWVAGKSSNLQSPNIYHFDGDKWEKAKFGNWPYIKVWTGKYNIKAIKFINANQGWAVGEYDPLLSSIKGKKGVIFYYDNLKNTWAEGSFNKLSHSNLDQVTLNNIAMLSSNQGWVLGNTVNIKWDFSANNELNGNLLKTDGRTIDIETKFQITTPGKSFFGIDLLPNGNGIIVGEGGLVLHHQYDITKPYQYNNFSTFTSSLNSSYNNYGSYYGY